MRNIIISIGKIGSIVFITIASILLSLIVTSTLSLAIKSDITSFTIFTAIITPTIVAPIVSWFIIDLLIKIHYLEEEQRRLAAFDYLTETLTRRFFMESSKNLLKQCKRTNTKLTIAIIDIDNFKSINDTYGHAAGDEVLRSFSKVMHNILRANDMIGRVGGEEFAVSMFGIHADNAMIALERLRIAIESDIVYYMGKNINYTVSIGVSEYDKKSSNELDSILKYADDALYKAKATGKNRIEKNTTY